MDRKYFIYGGVGVAALLGGYLLLGRSSSSSGSSADSSYYPPLVYGGGGAQTSTGSLPDTSTDNSINQILASTLQQAQLQANVSMAQLSNDREIALAGYTTDLAKTKLTTSAAVESSLASQLGNIVSYMVGRKSSSSSSSGFFGIGGGSDANMTQEGLKSVSGSIGFNQDTGQISVDLAKNVSSQLNLPPTVPVPTPAPAPTFSIFGNTNYSHGSR